MIREEPHEMLDWSSIKGILAQDARCALGMPLI